MKTTVRESEEEKIKGGWGIHLEKRDGEKT